MGTVEIDHNIDYFNLSLYECECYRATSRCIDSILAQCWASVCDAVPTLRQHRINASCQLADTDAIRSKPVGTAFQISDSWTFVGPSVDAWRQRAAYIQPINEYLNKLHF